MNPFIDNISGKFGSIPFSKIKNEHFIPAIKQGIKEGKANIKKICAIKNPNFENTIFALEHVSEILDNASGVYFNLHSAEAKPELAALASKVSVLCSNFGSDIFLNENLFKKIKFVYDNQKKEKLNTEQKKLLENTYKAFVRNGALLKSSQKKKLKKIDEEISKLSPKFSDNVLKATNAFELKITNKDDLVGLPEMYISAAKEDALLKKYENTWLFTLQAPSFIPFMQYSQKRNLREKMWRAYNGRCTSGKLSNQQVIQKTIELKILRSKILGYKTYADYVLEERMAKNTTKVFSFLKNLLKYSKPAAERDLNEVKEYAFKKDGLKDFMPWDYSYYAEALKKEKYSFDEQLLRPYFLLEKVIDGVFEVAAKLYQLKFKKLEGIDVYHPDVRVFEVLDAKSQNQIGLFYCDFFPRATKKGGAWASDFRRQGLNKNHKMENPHATIVCNFTKPTPAEPSLLSFDEVNTLYHEFGHALHHLLSNCTYKSLSGTNVYWDFVELPSQFMENFLLEKEVLDIFAVHYKTGEKIPQDMIDKLKKSSKFQAGYFSLRQLNFAFLDMEWYTLQKISKKINVLDFETKVTKPTRLFEPIIGANSSCAFSHIFSGGYSAGYYSYKWAEVLDADAFEFFKEKGLFNPQVSKSFRENILSRGGTEHPMDLYKKFRTREPDPNALLRRDGLI